MNFNFGKYAEDKFVSGISYVNGTFFGDYQDSKQTGKAITVNQYGEKYEGDYD